MSGRLWFGDHWESQLFETSLHVSLLACPLVTISGNVAFPAEGHLTRWVLQWLVARILLARALVVQRSDSVCWHAQPWDEAALSCWQQFYDHLPLPSRTSWHAHALMPTVVGLAQAFSLVRIEAWIGVALLLPWRRARHAAAATTLLLYFVSALFGEQSYFNCVTAIPCLAFFDDHFYGSLLPKLKAFRPNPYAGERGGVLRAIQVFMVTSAAIWLLLLSLPSAAALAFQSERGAPRWALAFRDAHRPWPVGNLYQKPALSPALDRYTQLVQPAPERLEVVLWALHCPDAPRNGSSAESDGGHSSGFLCRWVELDVHCKPGNVDRAPCVPSLFQPFQRRLARQLRWLPTARERGWFDTFLRQLAAGRPDAWLAIEADIPWGKDGLLPLALSAQLYSYSYGGGGERAASAASARPSWVEWPRALEHLPQDPRNGKWWRREFRGSFSRVIHVGSNYLRARGDRREEEHKRDEQ